MNEAEVKEYVGDETFKPVCGFGGFYQVSNKGTVRSCSNTVVRSNDRPYKVPVKILSSHVSSKDGYARVVLYKRGQKSTHLVHRLVAQSFIPNPLNKGDVNHVDGDKQNNNMNNLEWATRQENINHAFVVGLRKSYGNSSNCRKLNETEVSAMRVLNDYGVSIPCLGRLYGVSRHTAWDIIRGRAWLESEL